MKVKPDVAGGELAAFVQKGALAQAAADGLIAASAPVQRITKTIRIDPAVDVVLKETVFSHWKNTGVRITESDIIDLAVRQYLKI